VSPFFGLTPDDIENLILEPSFLLTYYGGFTWLDTCVMPVAFKRWYIERINKELTRKNEKGEDAGADRTAPAEIRALEGMAHPDAPPRLRRFT
jgi:hypothetical protein